MGLLWITRDILCGNGSFFSIFSILGGCASQSSTNNKQPARELLSVSSVVTSRKRIISPRDDIFGDIHHSERSSANREKSGGGVVAGHGGGLSGGTSNHRAELRVNTYPAPRRS